MSGVASASEWVWLARLRRPQGRKGEVFAEILTDFPEKFAERRHLWLLPEQSAITAMPREIELVHHWLHKGGVVLQFNGIDSISEAETLAGFIVAIPRAARAALAEDEVHIADLIGCALIDVAVEPAATIGVIENVDRSAGAAPLLIVQSATGEVLIPFAKSYLRTLDVENHRVVMALPEGLSGVNS